jgi:hypothetical protein
VEGVFGIDNRPVAKPHFQISKTSNGESGRTPRVARLTRPSLQSSTTFRRCRRLRAVHRHS